MLLLHPVRQPRNQAGGPLTASFLWLSLSASLFCQTPLPLKNVVKVAPVDAVQAKAGAITNLTISVQVDEGFHVNSNTPADKFLIPLGLTWNAGPLESSGITFPKPQTAKLPFSSEPVSIFTGSFGIVTRFKVARGANPGPGSVTGRLHYQACNDHECLAPKFLDVTVPVEIVK